MRALIVSDIHANLNALQTVVADAEERGGFDVIWCLGDTVGYGPSPGPCLDLLQRYPFVAVAGNHDHAALGRIDVTYFNAAAAIAANWTAEQLTSGDIALLSGLPQVATASPFTLVHGSLRAPLEEYLLSPEAARTTLDLMTTPYCLVGHSHLPFICLENRNGPEFVGFIEDVPHALDERRRIINPGSVGQPRDNDPRAGYAIYDSEPGLVEHHRVSYDIAETQSEMRRAGLPQPLIDRLDYGV